jgi:hypothetical protein
MNKKHLKNTKVMLGMKIKYYKPTITTLEAATLLDVSQRTARRKLELLRASYQKSRNQVITIEEFCDYFGVPYKTAFCCINKLKFPEYDQLLTDGLIEAPAPKHRKVGS